MIAAIETQYAGCRFRSRLEARWAVFFDHLGVRWEYEPQGYNLHRLLNDIDIPRWWDGPLPKTTYLPDFYLPGIDTFYEVKGARPTGQEWWTLRGFGLAVGSGLLPEATRFYVAIGGIPRSDIPPGQVHYDWVVERWNDGPGEWPPHLIQCSADPSAHSGWHWTQCPYCDAFDVTLYGAVECSCASGLKTIFNDGSGQLMDAYGAARSARFEHGENGRRRR